MSEKIVAVDRALDILIYLQEKNQEAGVTEISNALGLPKSTVHRTLVTLEAKDFVTQNLKNDNYWLGMRLYGMGDAVKNKITIIDILKPHSDLLHSKIHEVINVSILNEPLNGSGYTTTIIYKQTNQSLNSVLSVNPDLGSVIDAHASSVGKCMMAFRDDLNYEAIKNTSLKKYTDKTITDYDTLIEELKGIRARGYSVDDEEQEMGLFCIGAPLFNRNGEVIAAISISGPMARMNNEYKEDKINLLLQTAKNINDVLKHTT